MALVVLLQDYKDVPSACRNLESFCETASKPLTYDRFGSTRFFDWLVSISDEDSFPEIALSDAYK